jgi:hypothetical protein
VKARRFLTIEAVIKAGEADPTSAVKQAVAAQQDKIKDAVVRLNIQVPSTLESRLRDSEIREALTQAHFVSVTREVQRESRLRLGSRKVEGITPYAALEAWLETQNIDPERRKVLLEYGQELIDSQEPRS